MAYRPRFVATLYKKMSSGKTYWYLREIAAFDGKPKMVSKRSLGTAAKIAAQIDGREARTLPERTRHLASGVAAAWGCWPASDAPAIIDRACGGRPAGRRCHRDLPGAGNAEPGRRPCSKGAFADSSRTTAADRFTKIPVSALDRRRFSDAMHAVQRAALPRIAEKRWLRRAPGRAGESRSRWT